MIKSVVSSLFADSVFIFFLQPGAGMEALSHLKTWKIELHFEVFSETEKVLVRIPIVKENGVFVGCSQFCA